VRLAVDGVLQGWLVLLQGRHCAELQKGLQYWIVLPQGRQPAVLPRAVLLQWARQYGEDARASLQLQGRHQLLLLLPTAPASWEHLLLAW
jgi:hypothetical protein